MRLREQLVKSTEAERATAAAVPEESVPKTHENEMGEGEKGQDHPEV